MIVNKVAPVICILVLTSATLMAQTGAQQSLIHGVVSAQSLTDANEEQEFQFTDASIRSAGIGIETRYPVSNSREIGFNTSVFLPFGIEQIVNGQTRSLERTDYDLFYILNFSGDIARYWEESRIRPWLGIGPRISILHATARETTSNIFGTNETNRSSFRMTAGIEIDAGVAFSFGRRGSVMVSVAPFYDILGYRSFARDEGSYEELGRLDQYGFSLRVGVGTRAEQ